MTPSVSKLDRALLDAVAKAMFAQDDRGRLIGDGPDLYVLRTAHEVVCRIHANLPQGTADALAAAASRPRGRPAAWAADYAVYLDILRSIGPLGAVRAGPLYTFPDDRTGSGITIGVDEGNADVLRGGLEEWLPDVKAGRPTSAVICDGHAVSICTSVRASEVVHCAGVETLPGHRGRGFAAATVAAWAHAVEAAGASPLYGTTFDNIASQRVAARLGLRFSVRNFR